MSKWQLMKTLSESLLPKDTHLLLKGSNPGDILEELLLPLRHDSRVRDWEIFRSSLVPSPSAATPGDDSCIMSLHHCRTDSISSLVLAAGKSQSGIATSETGIKTHLYFIAGIPSALNTEYLRVLGAISRVCRDPDSITELLAATNPVDFISILEKGCSR